VLVNKTGVFIFISIVIPVILALILLIGFTFNFYIVCGAVLHSGFDIEIM
jgi:hypothetical protein